jgi:hypothetical protein
MAERVLRRIPALPLPAAQISLLVQDNVLEKQQVVLCLPLLVQLSLLQPKLSMLQAFYTSLQIIFIMLKEQHHKTLVL